MQRIGLTGRRIIFAIAISLILIALIAIDLLTKSAFVSLFEKKGETEIIPGFFYFTYVKNTGSAFGFMANLSWSQAFFKIFTALSLLLFIAFLVYAVITKRRFLSIALILIISGAIGNFIDRLVFSYVRDFIGFTFGSYNFPIFNFADTCLTIGAILFFINFLFVDKEAIFRKNGKKDTESK